MCVNVCVWSFESLPVLSMPTQVNVCLSVCLILHSPWARQQAWSPSLGVCGQTLVWRGSKNEKQWNSSGPCSWKVTWTVTASSSSPSLQNKLLPSGPRSNQASTKSSTSFACSSVCLFFLSSCRYRVTLAVVPLKGQKFQIHLPSTGTVETTRSSRDLHSDPTWWRLGELTSSYQQGGVGLVHSNSKTCGTGDERSKATRIQSNNSKAFNYQMILR